MQAHKLATYEDNRLSIVYCELCSAEGQDLFCPCPGKYVGKDNSKTVDNKKEND